MPKRKIELVGKMRTALPSNTLGTFSLGVVRGQATVDSTVGKIRKCFLSLFNDGITPLI